jgi:hypothetical protein
MAKIGQNQPEWPQKDVYDIKNFCFCITLASDLPQSKKSAQKKLTPLYRPKNGQN